MTLPGKFYCRACSKHLRLAFTPGVLDFPGGPIGLLPRCACGGEVLPFDEAGVQLRQRMNASALLLADLEQEVGA